MIVHPHLLLPVCERRRVCWWLMCPRPNSANVTSATHQNTFCANHHAFFATHQSWSYAADQDKRWGDANEDKNDAGENYAMCINSDPRPIVFVIRVLTNQLSLFTLHVIFKAEAQWGWWWWWWWWWGGQWRHNPRAKLVPGVLYCPRQSRSHLLYTDILTHSLALL